MHLLVNAYRELTNAGTINPVMIQILYPYGACITFALS
jgi:hypothetical protein